MIDFNKIYYNHDLVIFETCMFCKKDTTWTTDTIASTLPYSSYPKNDMIISWYSCKPCEFKIKTYNGSITAFFKIKENDHKRNNDFMIVVDISGARLMDNGKVIKMLKHNLNEMKDVADSYRVLI